MSMASSSERTGAPRPRGAGTLGYWLIGVPLRLLGSLLQLVGQVGEALDVLAVHLERMLGLVEAEADEVVEVQLAHAGIAHAPLGRRLHIVLEEEVSPFGEQL